MDSVNVLFTNRYLGWINIRHTATAKDIVRLHAVGSDGQENTLGMGHCTLVTATIDVSHLTNLQVPLRTDGHGCLVVTTEQTTHLVGTTAGIREAGVDAHLVFEALIRQQFTTCTSIWIGGINNTIHHLAMVAHIDDGTVRNGHVITTTVCINDRTAANFQISPSHLWLLNVGDGFPINRNVV